MEACPIYIDSLGRGIPVNDFITPSNPAVIEVAKQLEGQNPFAAGLGFITQNIRYETDRRQFAALERWAYPAETLQSRKGDCEDMSFLLASILLAMDVPAPTVGVELGHFKGNGHAWVWVKDYYDREHILETTNAVAPRHYVNIMPKSGVGSEDYTPELRIHQTGCVRLGPQTLYNAVQLRYPKDGDE